MQTTPLTWITDEYSTYDVIVAPTKQEFSDYADSTIWVYIKAIDSEDTSRFNDFATFSIKFACNTSELKVVEEFSPFHIFSIPQTATINFPLYEPWPSCGFTNTDVTYSVADDSELPYWATLNQLERTLTVDVKTSDAADLAGTTTDFNF